MQQGGARLLGWRGRRKGRRHHSFSRDEKCVEVLDEVARVDDAEQLDVVGREHDAVIAGALADVAAARREREAKPAPAGAGTLEIPHPDNDMIDPRYGIGHPILPLRPAARLPSRTFQNQPRHLFHLFYQV